MEERPSYLAARLRGLGTSIFAEMSALAARGRPLVRFSFCKRDDVLDEAVVRLKALR